MNWRRLRWLEWEYALRWTWERLTVLMLRRGYAEIYMRHFLASEFDRLCADPVMRERIGVECSPTEHN